MHRSAADSLLSVFEVTFYKVYIEMHRSAADSLLSVFKISLLSLYWNAVDSLSVFKRADIKAKSMY